MSLDYELGTYGDSARLRLIGRIDRAGEDVLSAAYSAAATSAPLVIELDFAAVDYINSTGIALIVGLLAKARAQGVLVRAAGLTPHYQHIFEITRLSDFVEIVPASGSRREHVSP